MDLRYELTTLVLQQKYVIVLLTSIFEPPLMGYIVVPEPFGWVYGEVDVEIASDASISFAALIG